MGLKFEVMAGVAVSVVSAAAAGAQVLPFAAADWEVQPSQAELLAAWPASTPTSIYEGKVQLECGLDSARRPNACRVIDEYPLDLGFAAAALSLVGKYEIKAGKAPPSGGRVALSVSLQAPGYTRVEWLRKPTRADLQAVWPVEAWKHGQGGWSAVSCKVSEAGMLFACAADAEKPAGAGFGAAAVALTPQFKMKPATFRGVPVASSVRIPIVFPNFSPSMVNAASASLMDATDFWLSAPSYADVFAAYPAKARNPRVDGHVTLNCVVAKDGLLKQCATITEAPSGMGFAEAAKRLSKHFVADMPTVRPRATGEIWVHLPIAFLSGMLDGQTPILEGPAWSQLPTAEQAGEIYPDAADKAGVLTGRAVLSCRVLAEGKVDCGVRTEEPAGYDFGDAAMRLAPNFRLKIWTASGTPVIGSAVAIPIRFNMDAPPPAAAKP